jgi:hypothetical protein
VGLAGDLRPANPEVFESLANTVLVGSIRRLAIDRVGTQIRLGYISIGRVMGVDAVFTVGHMGF